MKLKTSKSSLFGEVYIPGSKSHTIRGLVFGMLANGESQIIAPLFSADTISCIEGCKALGAKIEIIEANPKIVKITGINGKPKPITNFIDVGNSGTSLRLLASAAALCDKEITFDGDSSLRTRLMQPLLTALKNLGAKVSESVNNSGKCPIKIKGPILGGFTEVNGLSSQYLSSLLISAPLINQDTVIKVIDLHEKPYVEITLKWLNEMGIEYLCENFETFKIKGGQKYSSFSKRIPADFSTACFTLCAAAITKSKLTIMGLDFSDAQGDKIVFEHLKKMGVKIDTKMHSTTVDATACDLQGIEIDLNATPDALPILAVVGCFAKGKTYLKNVAQARIKECDRISAMTKELTKLGAKIEELSDGMIIHCSLLKGTTVHGWDDHRIVMALAIAGMNASGETIVDTAESFKVTYPEFFDDMKNLNANILIN